jgi:microcystin-dependent protein
LARNGSGTYSKVNTFVAGATITASSHNANWDDLTIEITNSVAADGQTTMTGPLKASSGSVGAPSQTFGSDLDTGRYRKSSNTMADVCAGAEVVEYSATGISVTGTANATTLKQGGFALLPVGTVFPYGGGSAPSGYLLCDGSAISRTTYSALFTVISGNFGAGDGSTTFNLPDLRGRVVAGKDDMGGSSANRLTDANDGLNGDTLGDTGGAETQTLETANLPAYTPAGTNSGGAASLSFTGPGNISQGGATSVVSNVTTGATPITFTQPTFTGTPQGGTSTAFGIVQPTIILNYIIFAGV